MLKAPFVSFSLNPRQANVGVPLEFPPQTLTSHLDSWATNLASANFSMVASVKMLG